MRLADDVVEVCMSNDRTGYRSASTSFEETSISRLNVKQLTVAGAAPANSE